MEVKQIISATIAVILVCLVAIPIIDGMPNYSYAYNDEGLKVSYIEKPTMTIEVTDASTKDITIDGVHIGDSSIYNITSSGFTFGYSTVPIFTHPGGTVNMATGDKVTITNGAWTFTPVSGSPLTGEIDWIFIPDENGSWIMSSNAINISADSKIAVVGFVKFVTSVFFGDLNELTQQFIVPSGSTMTVNLNKVSIENGLSYTVDCKNGLSGSNSQTSESGTGTGFVFAPIKYKVESNSIVDTIVDLIPVLLIVSVVIGVAYSLIPRRG